MNRTLYRALAGRVALVVVAGLILAGCAGADQARQPGSVSVPTTQNLTVATVPPAGMTYAECEASAQQPGFAGDDGTEYTGGQWAFEFDNGVCTVQN